MILYIETQRKIRIYAQVAGAIGSEKYGNGVDKNKLVIIVYYLLVHFHNQTFDYCSNIFNFRTFFGLLTLKLTKI